MGRGGWHEAMVLVCSPLVAPIGLWLLTLCRSERSLVVSMEPLDDLSCLTTPGSLTKCIYRANFKRAKPN